VTTTAGLHLVAHGGHPTSTANAAVITFFFVAIVDGCLFRGER
jgi:hypothetical protein